LCICVVWKHEYEYKIKYFKSGILNHRLFPISIWIFKIVDLFANRLINRTTYLYVTIIMYHIFYKYGISLFYHISNAKCPFYLYFSTFKFKIYSKILFLCTSSLFFSITRDHSEATNCKVKINDLYIQRDRP